VRPAASREKLAGVKNFTLALLTARHRRNLALVFQDNEVAFLNTEADRPQEVLPALRTTIGKPQGHVFYKGRAWKRSHCPQLLTLARL
jgi:hypothetical protein